MVRGSDAGEHQKLRRERGAGAQDDFLSLDNEVPAAAFDLHADRSFALEDEAARGAAIADGQVHPMARGIEISYRGADADAVGIVERHRADAGGVGQVMVGAIGKTCGPARVVKGFLIGQPFGARGAPRSYWTTGAVKIAAAEIKVVLKLAEIAQTVIEAPQRIAL